MKYPKYYIYEKLYRRYFLKGVDYFIKEANLTSHDKVLDIWGGNGRLTKELIKFSDNVSYLDKEKDMIPLDLEQLGIKVYNDSVENFIDTTNEKYTKVFCEAERELSNIPHSNSKTFNGILSAFSVPQPIREKKRKLGLLERIGGAISDVLNYGMIVDDGWVYGYNDYSLAALQKIKYGLKPKLEKEIDLMAEGASFVELLPEYTGFEDRMDELKKQIESWRKILRMCVLEEDTKSII